MTARAARAATTRIDRSLAGVTAFRELPDDVRRRLEGRCQWQHYEPGVEILGYQDPSRDVFFITRGRVRAVIYSHAGQAVAFRDLGAGDMFGELAAIDGERRSAGIEAVETCTIAKMSPAAFWDLVLAERAVTKAVLLHLNRLIRSLSTRVFEFSTLTVRNRIHAELLRLCRDQGATTKSVRLTRLPTHAELASRISTHREAVSRELARLAKLGLLERRSGAIIVTDVERLARMVDDATHE